jgi:hypothetical protein
MAIEEMLLDMAMRVGARNVADGAQDDIQLRDKVKVFLRGTKMQAWECCIQVVGPGAFLGTLLLMSMWLSLVHVRGIWGRSL